MGLMEFTKTIIKNLLSSSVTKSYQEEKNYNYELTRGHIEINTEDCLYCGLCSRKCPTEAISINRQNKEWKVNRLKCIQCGYCIENCPKKCIVMKNDYIKPTEVEIIDSY